MKHKQVLSNIGICLCNQLPNTTGTLVHEMNYFGGTVTEKEAPILVINVTREIKNCGKNARQNFIC